MATMVFNGRQDPIHWKSGASTYAKVINVLTCSLTTPTYGELPANCVDTPQNTNVKAKGRPDGQVVLTMTLNMDDADSTHTSIYALANTFGSDEFWYIIRKPDGTIYEKFRLTGCRVDPIEKSASDNQIMQRTITIRTDTLPDTTTSLPAGITTTLGATA